MRKSERGEIDVIDLVIIILILAGLLLGVGPCGSCFYTSPEQAPLNIHKNK